MNILLVEDDKSLADQVSMLLKKEHYVCDVCYDIENAALRYDEGSYQLILMDWNLPDGSGIHFLKQIREWGDNVAVLMLSGRESINERVEALDMGADDYLCKPYSNLELLARVRALLRRESHQKSTLFTKDDVSVDLGKREVRVAGEKVELTPKEFELLEILMLHKNNVLSRAQLAELLCKDFETLKSSNFVDVHVKNIRKKLNRPDIITTIRSIGYAIQT